MQMQLTSSAFDDGDAIPTMYTCDGDDVSPPLSVTNIPDGAEWLALIVDDPDAPAKTWVHWLCWNIPATAKLAEGSVPNGVGQGTNDFGRVGYGGPCPPQGHGAHTYRFVIHALDARIDLQEGASRSELEKAMEGHVLASATLRGTYERA